MKNAVIVGTGALPFNCAKYLKENEYRVCVLEYGAYAASMLADLCKKNDIVYEKVDKAKLKKRLSDLQETVLVISANNTYLFPNEIIEKKNIVAMNFHPALLPKHPGRNAEAWAIYDEDTVTGITWHMINKDVDAGDILIQEEIALDNKITSARLMQKQFQAGFIAFKKIMAMIDENGIDNLKRIHNSCKKSDIKLSSEKPNNGVLDINWSISKKSAFLRAMDYGKLQILGKPRCIIGEIEYEWDTYRMDINAEKKDNPEEGVFSDGSRVIELRGWRLVR